MSMQILLKEDVSAWVEHLIKWYAVVAPVEKNGRTVFRRISSPDEVNLSYSTSVLPPKKALLPTRELLIEFQGGPGEACVEPILNDTPTVLLGVHTCDIHAIYLLDRVFSGAVSDEHYMERRKNIIFAGVECLEPCSEKCFCKSMETLAVPEHFDLHMTDIGHAYALEFGSPSGLNLLWDFFSYQAAKDEDYEQLEKVMSEKWSRFAYRMKPDLSELPSLLAMNYDHPMWEELGARCLSCGACNLVCPTCYCFDVRDEVQLDLQTGNRFREWDSCQVANFALVAGGHDFRPSRGARLRHRVMHKGKYLPDRYGQVGCVGCGRCEEACPADISILEIFNQLKASLEKPTEVAQEIEI